MPHLKNFLEKEGTLSLNDHTILISHTGGGILSTLTGLYPDRHGQTVSSTFTTPSPGRYEFVCTIHQALGQTGTLVVLPN